MDMKGSIRGWDRAGNQGPASARLALAHLDWYEDYLEELPMNRAIMLVASCALAFPAIAFAQTADTKITPTNDVRKISPTIFVPKAGFILRQDLFDPNNPNNLRSDWPRPSRQPG